MACLPNKSWSVERMIRLAPAAAGDAAFRVFCTPALSERRDARYQCLSERARFHLRHARWIVSQTPVGAVHAYVFEPDAPIPQGTVLLVHGWTSEAAFMTALAEPIRRAGFRVVLFDLPAHGLNPGRSTNLVDCARATLAVAASFAPLAAIVAHSFGGMVSLLAIEGNPPMPHALETQHVVLIACPNRLSDVTRAFADRWGLSEAARKAFERRLERIGKRPLERYAIVELLRAANCGILVVHAEDDREVPFQCAEEIVAAHPHATLAPFDGFGHRNILYAPPVARTVVRQLRAATSDGGNDRLHGWAAGTERQDWPSQGEHPRPAGELPATVSGARRRRPIVPWLPKPPGPAGCATSRTQPKRR